MKDRGKYDQAWDDESGDGFTADDAYDRYGGPDLSGDPMVASEKPRGRRAKKEERERLRREAEKEAIRAEILAEMEAEKTGSQQAEEGEEDEDREKRPSKFVSYMMSFLSGNILSRQEVRKVYPYLLFIAFLAFIYIGNVFRMQHLYRKHERLSTEVKELRAKSMTIASEKMRATRQSSIIQEIERRGLPVKESLTPNRTIQK